MHVEHNEWTLNILNRTPKTLNELWRYWMKPDWCNHCHLLGSHTYSFIHFFCTCLFLSTGFSDILLVHNITFKKISQKGRGSGRFHLTEECTTANDFVALSHLSDTLWCDKATQSTSIQADASIISSEFLSGPQYQQVNLIYGESCPMVTMIMSDGWSLSVR